MLRVSKLLQDSIVDGPGLRTTIFLQGCNRNCKGCHNPSTHDINGGKDINEDEIISLVERNPLCDGVTISGGEPFLQDILPLVRELWKRQVNVIVYTGYTWEELLNNDSYTQILFYINYLVDGPFEESLKSLDLRFKGSSNQRVIDCKESLKQNKVILFDL